MRASGRLGVHPLLDAVQRPFAGRIRASRAWSWLALRCRRVPLALALALLPALVFLALAPFVPGLTQTDRVREVYARYISGLITAATIAVGFGALALRRGIKGIGELQEHMEADERYRERARKLLRREGLPLDVGGFLVEIHEHLARATRDTLRQASAAEQAIQADGARLDDTLRAIEASSTRAARAVADARGDPTRLLEAALDFEHDIAGHLVRHLARDGRMGDATRARLDDIAATVEAAATGTFYVKTLDTQWGLSRMANSIAVSAFFAVAVATFIALGYGEGIAFSARVALLAGSLFVLALPLGFFVSYVLRFVFVNQYSLAIGAFTLGPENEAMVTKRRSARRSRHGAD